jgi:hypothetical protein
MSRGRLVAGLNYRSRNLIDMSVPNILLRDISELQVFCASNVNDAQSAPVQMFSVLPGRFFASPSLRRSGRLGAEESNRDRTRFVFDLADYATTFQVNTPRIPTDDESAYIRLRGLLRSGEVTDFGPIVCVPPYDFLSVTHPIFTCSGNAPDLDSGGVIPDTLSTGAMNIHLPYFAQTTNVQNLSSAVGGSNLFLTFSPGCSPTILRPGEQVNITGGAAPEFFLAGESGTPLFTIRCALVNQG